MKKITALLFTLVLVWSITACGSGSSVGETNTLNESTKAPTSAVEPTATPGLTEVSTPEPTESPSTYTWGGTQMPIPEPPYAYEVELSQRDNSTSVRVTATNGGEDGDVTHSKILDYCEDIKAAGFTVNLSENVIGERYGRTCYSFNAQNEEGSSVELLDDGGGVMLFVTVVNNGAVQ